MPKQMSVGEIKEVLERIQEIYALAGASGPAADFKRLIATLSGHEDETVDQFVEDTRVLLRVAASGNTKKPTQPNVNEEVVGEHVRRLLVAGVSTSAFQAAFTKLKNDARVQKADLFAIANRYLNDPTGGTFEFEFESNQAAYSAVKRMFVERAQDENKARIIRRMTG